MRDRGTGRPRGFGFVTYKDPDVADRVVKDTHMVDGRQVRTAISIVGFIEIESRFCSLQI